MLLSLLFEVRRESCTHREIASLLSICFLNGFVHRMEFLKKMLGAVKDSGMLEG